VSSGEFVEVGVGTQRDKAVELERLRAENADVRRRVSELERRIAELERRIAELERRIAELERRVAELERLIKPLGGAAGTERLGAAYSLRAEEQRQAAKAGGKQRAARRGRMEIVLPEGFAIEDCRLLCRRPVWRIEQGRAVLVAYEFYLGPQGERGTAAIGEPTKPAAASAAHVAAPSWPACWNRSARDSPRST